MKKTFLIIALLCSGLCLTALLSSCTEEAHEHSYKTEWSYDEDSHWHACDANCIVVSEKAAHTWDEGEVKTEATADKNGEMTFTCTVCNYKKGEPITFTGISEEKWDSMLATPNFENYTLRQYGKINYGGAQTIEEDATIKFVKDKVSINLKSGGYTDTLLFTGEEAIMQKASYEQVFLALLENYDEYVYDATKNVYKNPSPVSVTIDFPLYDSSASIEMENGEISLSDDGKLVKFQCDFTQTTSTPHGISSVYTYMTWELSDYGNTVIEDTAQ